MNPSRCLFLNQLGLVTAGISLAAQLPTFADMTAFRRMFKIIKDAGFSGYAGIEYEGGLMHTYNPTGGYLSATDGIRATKTLLERVRTELV